MSFLPYSKLHVMVVIVTLAKDCSLSDVAIITQQLNNPKPLLCEAENQAYN
jgi:hypothetical protein